MRLHMRFPAHASWQKEGHAVGNIWTMDKLKSHRQESVIWTSKKPYDVKGVKGKIIFNTVHWKYWIVPVLQRITVGISNAILKYCLHWIDTCIESLPEMVLESQEEMLENEVKLDYNAAYNIWQDEGGAISDSLIRKVDCVSVGKGKEWWRVICFVGGRTKRRLRIYWTIFGVVKSRFCRQQRKSMWNHDCRKIAKIKVEIAV